MHLQSWSRALLAALLVAAIAVPGVVAPVLVGQDAAGVARAQAPGAGTGAAAPSPEAKSAAPAATGGPPAEAKAGVAKAPAAEAAPQATAPADAAAATGGTAEPPATPTSVAIDPAEAALITAWRSELDRVSASLATATDERRLDALAGRAADVRDAADAKVVALAPRLRSLQARVAELTAPDGSVEAEALAKTREDEAAALASLAAVESQARLVRLSAEELVTAVSEKRRSLLGERLVIHRRSILDPTLWMDVAGELPRSAKSFGLLIRDWSSVIAERGGSFAALVVALALAGAAILILPVRRILVSRVAGRQFVGPVPRLNRALAAASVFAVTLAVPVGALLIVRASLSALDLLPARVDTALGGIIVAVGWLAAAHGLTRALLAPARPGWRLVTLADDTVEQLTRWIFGGSAIYAVGIAVLALSRVVAAPEFIADAVQAVLAVVVAVIVASVLRILAHGLGEDSPTDQPVRWRWIIPIAWLVALVTGVAALLGYLSLAWFLASQLVWAAMVLALLFLLQILVDEGASALFKPRTGLGLFLSGSMGLSANAIAQIGIVLSALARLLLLLVAVAAIVARFGVTATELSAIPGLIVRGLSIGGLTISPSALIGCVVLLLIGIAATRALQRWLDQKFLPNTRLDVGLKASIRTTVGYLGLAISVAIAFAYAGVGLQNIAIVAGALSVGVGFGLQSIVNNFVSGLILLAERPIKIGDWIVVGADEGNVRRINVRSTEIQTFDGAVVILPNSNLITGTVKNWNHARLNGRALIEIGVSYEADPELVRDTLLACARAHPQVLKSPAPFVQIARLTDSAVVFQLFAYVAGAGDAGGVKSDLHFAIFRRFRETGIDIAAAQRTVTLRGFERLEQTLSAELRSAGAGREAAIRGDGEA